jgi:hypothetical protein
MATELEHVDVLIVGAGLSGIGAGCHLRMECPDKTFTILEARDSIGGTWDLFRYPGIRSDSDMYTLGFRFRPWPDAKTIADGPAILKYVKDTAAEYGIDQEIRYHHKVLRADWSSEDALWTVRPSGAIRARPSSSPAASSSPAPATTATTRASPPISRASRASRARSSTPSIGPRTSITRASESSSSAAEPRR